MTEPSGEPRAEGGAAPEKGEGADPTGDARVDEAVALLAPLETTPVTEHVAVFDEVHRRLQDTLASLDRG